MEAELQLLGTGLGQDTTMKTCTSSLMFLMAGPRFTSHHPGLSRPSTDFIVKVRCHPPGPRNRLGGRQRTPGTVTQSRTCSSAPALAYLRARAKGTRHLSTQSRSGSTFPLVDSQADNAPVKICLASAMKVYVWGLSVYTESIEPAVQELIWLKALLQCRGCPELPGRIHRWCFLCGSSLAVYFADEQEERERKLQIHLSRLSKYRAT